MNTYDTLIYVLGSTSNVAILAALTRRRAFKTLPRIAWAEVGSWCLSAVWMFGAYSRSVWFACYWASIFSYLWLIVAMMHYPRTRFAEWLPIAYSIQIAIELDQARLHFYPSLPLYYARSWLGIAAAIFMVICLERNMIVPRSQTYEPRS